MVAVEEAYMPIRKNIAYRLAYETATLELERIQVAMQRMQLQRDEIENQLHSDNALPLPGFFPSAA
jgi:hypothetical protein